MSFDVYTPLEDRVLIKPIKKTESEKSDGGIILDPVKKEVAEGVVFAIGEGRYAPENGTFIPNVLRKGDVVLYGVNAGMPFEVPDETGKKTEMRLLREADVLAFIKKSE